MLASTFLTLPQAAAETLKEALASAYVTNPGLDAQRATLRATDEEVPRAKAGYRPTVSGSADAGVTHTNSKPPSAGDGELHPKGYAVTLSQPLFRGFRVFNTVNVAEANVRAGREQLRVLEQQTLLEAATAYMDVVRDQAILRVRENNVRVLTNELRATQERFAVGEVTRTDGARASCFRGSARHGEVTRTDVAQAQARRAGAISQLDLAKSNLRTSLASYERVIGHPAGNVRDEPPIERLLPKNVNDAIQVATAEHPSVVQSVYLEQAARHQIDVIKGELLPTVSLETQYQHRYEPSRTTDQTEAASVTGRLTWQFWNGGEVESRVRQAKHTAVSRLQQIEQNRAQVQAGAVQAWSSLAAARAQLISDQQQVDSNRTALTGVREEEKVGQRTLLDVLNAEQELLNAELALITTKRNLVVASYTLVSAIGRLTAYDLALNTKVYDETAHYDEVKRKWFGTRVEYADGRLEDGPGPGAGPARHVDNFGAPQLRSSVRTPIAARPVPKPPAPPAPAAAPAPGSESGSSGSNVAPVAPGAVPAPAAPATATPGSGPVNIVPPGARNRPGTRGAPAPAPGGAPGVTPPAVPGKGSSLMREPGQSEVTEQPQLRGSLESKAWQASTNR